MNAHISLHGSQTARAEKFAALRNKINVVLQRATKEDDRFVKEANECLLWCRENPGKAPYERDEEGRIVKMVMPGAVHVARTLDSVSVQYANADYIGEQLMPVVSAPRLADKYFTYSKRDRLAFPDDVIGARGSANEIDESRSTDNYSLTGYALKNFVDVTTLQNQDSPLNEMVDLVEAIAEGIAFKTELRHAAILTTSGNFGSTAAAATAWSSANGGSIIKDLQTARAALWMGRGPGDFVGFCSLDVANAMQRNAALLELMKYTKGGLVPMDEIAKMFGLSKILVGEARKDTANSGQAASYSRIWSDVFGIVRVARQPSIRNAAFGYTFRLGGTVKTRTWFNENVGTDGGYHAQISKHEVAKVVASDTGYLLTSVIA